MMKRNIINWFRIINWREFNLRYRLVDVQVLGASDEEKDVHKAFNNALTHLAYATKGPVSFAFLNDKRYIAVKADAQLQHEIISGTPLNIELTPLDGEYFLNPATMDKRNLDVALRFLESAITWQLNSNRNLWDGGGNAFLKKKPLHLSNDIETDIYNGFKFKVIAEDINNVFLCIDLAYRYADKYTLDQVLSNLPKSQYADFINNRNFLYLNGDNWYTVKGKSIGNPINQHKIPIKNGAMTVYDYITNEGKYKNAQWKLPLPEQSLTFFHTHGAKADKIYAGAAALAKRIRFAEDELHQNSINDPGKRFTRIEQHVKNYFQNLWFNGVKLQIDVRPYRKSCNQFALPALKYGKNAVLDPYNGYVKYGRAIDHFPKRRREFVYKFSIINDSMFVNQHIFFPDTFDLSFGKALQFHFEKGMKDVAKHFPSMSLHQYSMKSAPFAHKVFAEIREYIQQKNLTSSSILFVLPEDQGDGGRFVKALRQVVKKDLFNKVKIKCVSITKLLKFFKQSVAQNNRMQWSVTDLLMTNFRSYLSNTIFEYLIINRKWPFALARKLHHDLYIGIDAHDFYAGFCFFFGNGEKIVFDVDKVVKPTGTFRNEKINFKTISDKIFEVLSRHIKVSDAPKSIVILRDGISYGEEEKALNDALQRLAEEGVISKGSVATGVIDISKSSAVPVRSAEISANGHMLTNPDCGTYFMMNAEDAFIFNTGHPYEVRGSSNPIHVRRSSGNINFLNALEDIFILTQIAFSSPDRPTSLPLPLKLIDTLIRDIAHENDLATVTHNEVNGGLKIKKLQPL